MGEEWEEYVFIYYDLDQPMTPQSHRDISLYSFPEGLLNGSFYFSVDVLCYFSTDEEREFYFRQQHSIPFEGYVKPTPPPIETYRQDRCIICLESEPNILYLDCLHIAVCASCDARKRNASKRNNNYCDVCRAEISKKLRI